MLGILRGELPLPAEFDPDADKSPLPPVHKSQSQSQSQSQDRPPFDASFGPGVADRRSSALLAKLSEPGVAARGDARQLFQAASDALAEGKRGQQPSAEFTEALLFRSLAAYDRMLSTPEKERRRAAKGPLSADPEFRSEAVEDPERYSPLAATRQSTAEPTERQQQQQQQQQQQTVVLGRHRIVSSLDHK